jgi:hypothetical protein
MNDHIAGERRTSQNIFKPILYFMLEMTVFGLIFMLIYKVSDIFFSETIAYILMGAFGIWSLQFIKESSIPRFKRVYNRTKKNNI